MAIDFVTGQRLTADLLNTNVNAFFPIVTTKTSATARTSTTTLANDPELAGITLDVGTWEVEMLIHWTLTTTNTQKIKTRWSFSGTASSTFRDCIGAGATQSTPAAPTVLTESSFVAATWDTQDVIYHQAAGATYGSSREISRTFTVTVAGDLALQWAQQTSSANATTVQPGSSITVRKIS